MGGKNSSESINKYMSKVYDRINLTVPKGRKEIIKDHAESRRESVNGFINRAITETMGRDAAHGGAGDHPSACSGGGVPLSVEALEAAEQGAKATGENLSQFVSRSVVTQAKRDKTALALGVNPAKNGAGDE